MKSQCDKVRDEAVGASKNEAYCEGRQRAFVSARFDEAPTRGFCGVRGGCSWCSWRSADVLRAGESRDDEHWGPAVWAHEGGSYAVGLGGGCGEIGGQLRCGLIQEL